MKKLFYSLFALAMTAMTFTSCEDVPMPYDDPNKNPGGAETEESVEPAGSGTAEDPYNVAAIIELVQGMEAGVESTENYYFKGKICAITEEYSTEYGNATFYISDTGTNNSATRFYIYRGLYLGNKSFAAGNEQIKIGDEVVICGKVVNYNGSTPETVQKKAYLYSLNGQGGGGGSTTAIDVTCAQAVELTNALADGGTSSETYSVTGYITEVVGSPSKNQQTFWMADTKDGGKVFEAYWANLPDGVSEFKAGMKVKIIGNLMKYVKDGKVTPEMKNATVVVLDEGGGGGSSSGTEINCTKAVELTNALADGGTSTEVYSVTGYITEVVGSVSKNQQTFWMADTKDGGKVFEAYWANLPDGVSEFKAGMKVKITGNLMKYVKDGKVTPEMKNATVVILDEGGGGGGQSGSAKGTGTLSDPYNAVAAANAVSGLTWTSNTEYQKTGDVYVKGKISRIAKSGTFGESGTYGNASFYISDDGSENNEFYVFRTLYLGNVQYTSGTDIKVGDEVIICGKLMNYKGNTPETVANESYLYSLNGQGGGGGGQQESGDQGSYSNPISVSKALSTDNSSTPMAWVKGYIVGYVSGKTYADGVTFSAEGCDVNTNIIIAESASTTSADKCMPVQLPSGDLRNGLNLKDNPSLLGKEIIIYGQLANYFSVPGIKSPKYAEAGGNSFGKKP